MALLFEFSGSGAVGHPVKPLDHLGPRRADPEREATAGEFVDPGRGHGQQSRRPAVDVDDRGPDLDALGPGRDVTGQRDRVEAVGLGQPDRVQPDDLQLTDRARGLHGVAGVVGQQGGESHAGHRPTSTGSTS